MAFETPQMSSCFDKNKISRKGLSYCHASLTIVSVLSLSIFFLCTLDFRPSAFLPSSFCPPYLQPTGTECGNGATEHLRDAALRI